MQTTTCSEAYSASFARCVAYSSAAVSSWIEQGPTTSRKRGSRPSAIADTSWRRAATLACASAETGCIRARSLGVGRISEEGIGVVFGGKKKGQKRKPPGPFGAGGLETS